MNSTLVLNLCGNLYYANLWWTKSSYCLFVLQNFGFSFECNEVYFQAALKFLHGASLLESNSENSKPREMNQIQIYIYTAKLCE